MPTQAEIFNAMRSRGFFNEEQEAIIQGLEKSGRLDQAMGALVEAVMPQDPTPLEGNAPAIQEDIPTAQSPPPLGPTAIEPQQVPAGPQPWAQRADQPLTEEPFKEFGRYALGAGDAALSGASKGIGMIASGVGGLARLATGAGPDAAKQTIEDIQKKSVFGYEPKSEMGKVIGGFSERAMTAPIEAPLAAYGGLTDVVAGAAGRSLGPTAGGLTGSVMSTIPVAAAEYLGAKGAGKLARSRLVSDGGPTPRFKEALNKQGLDPGDIGPRGQRLLEKQAYNDPEHAARAAFLEEQGFKGKAAPTRAQVTRQRSEFVTQQELAKETNQVSGRLENQNALLKDKFDRASGAAGRQPGALSLKETSGSPTFDRVQDRITALDNEMHDMYQQAKTKTEGLEIIRPEGLINALERFRGDNDLTNGMITAIEGVAKNRGFYDPKTKKLTRDISADEAEGMVQSINKRFKGSGNANANRIGRKLKDAIDLDVAKYMGGNEHKKARLKKRDLHRSLRPQKGKWAKRDVSLTEDILNETIPGNKILTKGILSPKYRANEVAHLKQFLHSGTPTEKIAGKKAWKDLKAEALEHIRDEAFTGPIDPMGNRTIKRASFEKAIRQFGDIDKLKSFFDADEIKLIKDMQKTLEIMEPTPGQFTGEGPTARAVNRRYQDISRRMGKFDVFKAFENMVFDPEGKALKAPTKSLKTRKAAGAIVAGTAAAKTMEDSDNE